MNTIYKRLFLTYGDSLLEDSGNFDSKEILSRLEELVPDRKACLRLEDLLYAYYTQWSIDAFAIGLHLGLSLLREESRLNGSVKGPKKIRRPRQRSRRSNPDSALL